MNKRHILSVAAAALLGLTACSEQSADGLTDRSDAEVRLTVGDLRITRAQDGLLDTFSGGEVLAMMMKDDESSAVTTANYTVGAGGTLTPAGSTKLLYPNTTGVQLYGVWPATSTESHTVADDQTGDAGYKNSDLLYAHKAVAKAEMAQTQAMQFSHQMAKLKIVISKTASMGNVTAVTLKNVQRKVTYEGLGTASLTLTPEADGSTDISFGPASASAAAEQTYCCVFPAQAWSNADFLTVTTDLGTATYHLTGSFTAGQVYQLTLNLTPLSVDQNVDLTGWATTITAETTEKLNIAAIGHQAYTGSPLTPALTVTNSAGTPLTLGTDYTVEYYDNTAVGTALVIVKGKGKYEGLTSIAKFDITVIGPSSITQDDIANNRGTSEKPRAWVICEDGDMHLCQGGTEVNPSSSVDSPVYLADTGKLKCGKKKVAVVCYVNTAGTVDKSTGSSGYRGLAIAIEDANGGSTCAWYTANSGTCVAQSNAIATALNTSQNDAQWWKGIDYTNQLGNGTGTCSGHTHAAAQAVLAYASASAGTGYSHAVPSGMSQWFMPTIAQWNLIVKGLTGGTADLQYGVANDTYKATNLNKYIQTAAGGKGVQSVNYWSSVEYDTKSAWHMRFGNGYAVGFNKSTTYYVRAVLAF